jgi:hypothetical protein
MDNGTKRGKMSIVHNVIIICEYIASSLSICQASANLKGGEGAMDGKHQEKSDGRSKTNSTGQRRS